MHRHDHHSTPAAASRPKRARVRRVEFARHYGAPMTAADTRRMTDGLELLGGEFAWIEHRDPEPHAQGVIRFSDKRELRSIADALGVEESAVRPLGRDPLAFARGLRYLTHPGEWDEYPDTAVVSNFDWQTERARLPELKAPTLGEIERALFAGDLTPAVVADRYRAMFVKHSRKLDAAYRRGEAHRVEAAEAATRARLEAEEERREQARQLAYERDEVAKAQAHRERERREAEAAERRAAEAAEAADRRAAQKAAQEAYACTPEGKAEAARKAAEAAAAREAEELFWLIAYAATDAGIPGGPDARRRAVAGLIDGELTADAVREFIGSIDGETAVQVSENVADFRRDIAHENQSVGIKIGHARERSESAFHQLLMQQRNAAKYPDLYDRVTLPPSRPGSPAVPMKWREQLAAITAEGVKA